jgi:hypothetical protein
LNSKLLYMQLVEMLEKITPDKQKLDMLGKEDVEMFLAERFWNEEN